MNGPSAALIESIQLLHSICTPTATISRRLHISESTVQFVIAHGTLPATQLPLVWAADPERVPAVRVSDR